MRSGSTPSTFDATLHAERSLVIQTFVPVARSQTQYLSDIDEAMTDAQQFAEGHTLEDFREDRKLRFAIERALEIIGEATSNVSDEVKAQDDALPWREMRGLRNVVAHEYHRVDPARVWRVVTQDIPRTQEKVRALLKTLEREESNR